MENNQIIFRHSWWKNGLFLCLGAALGCTSPVETGATGSGPSGENQWEQNAYPNGDTSTEQDFRDLPEDANRGVTLRFGDEEDEEDTVDVLPPQDVPSDLEDGGIEPDMGSWDENPEGPDSEEGPPQEEDTENPLGDGSETGPEGIDASPEPDASPDTDASTEEDTWEAPEEEDSLPPAPIEDCGTTDCGPNTVCTDTEGGPTCSCNDGFNQQGGTCQDVNECLGDPCDANSLCANTNGGFQCTPCPFGHTPEGDQCVPGFNLCGVGASQERSGGTWDEPLAAPYLPLVDEFSTAASNESMANTYDCAPTTNESGPEVVYAFTLPVSGYFRADLTDGAGVDIDLHLLKTPSISNGVVTGCIARNDSSIEIQNLEAGEYVLVADTYVTSSPQSGEYRISIEWIPDGQWTTIPIAPGITWKRMRTTTLPGDVQTIQMVEVDRQVGWDVEASPHNGCKTVSAYAPTLNALVGINGGFFNSSCGSLDLVKTNGVLHSTNEMTGYEQPTIGWNDGDPAQFSWIFPGQDFSGVNNGIGGFPSLVEASVPFAAVYPGEQVWSSGDWQPNPRSAMGFKNGHTMMFWTLDGRTDMGDGLSTPALAEALASWGAEYAMGLDGGGSTTLYIRDCSINSVVNFPSDNQKTDHKGMRSVSDGVYVR